MNIRKAVLEDARGIAEVHVDSWLSTYGSIVPDDNLDSLTYESREQSWQRGLTQEGIFAAEDAAGKIIGFATGGGERSGDYPDVEGELYAIYLLKDLQSKGTGRALTAAVAANLLEKGMSSMLVWVLADNPSRGFYERMGGRLLDEKTIEIAGVELLEVAYVWEDIRALAES